MTSTERTRAPDHPSAGWLLLAVCGLLCGSFGCNTLPGGDPLVGSWSGKITCSGDSAQVSFDLDGHGTVSDVDYTFNAIGAHGCGGEGEYDHSEDDDSFFMEIRYDDCSVDIGQLVKDRFWGEFDGVDTLTGDLGSDFCTFRFTQ